MIPIRIRREGDAEENKDYFEGNLEDFLTAAKEIGTRTVFVIVHHLEEEQFLYCFENDEDDADEESGVEEEVDLADYLPALAKYKRRIGDVYSYFLEAKGGAADICLLLDEKWFDEFVNEIERAEGMAVLARTKRTGDAS